jgi:hypothetical protein
MVTLIIIIWYPGHLEPAKKGFYRIIVIMEVIDTAGTIVDETYHGKGECNGTVGRFIRGTEGIWA